VIQAPERQPSRLLDGVTVALLGEVVPEVVSGAWLRLTALAGVAATGFVVVSGTLGGGRSHELWVAIALPPLVALSAAGVLARRRLLWPSAAALALVLVGAASGGALTVRGRPSWLSELHLVLAALAFAATAAAAVTAFTGGASVERPSWRDYVTLTKPRIMVLLLITCVGAMFVGDPRVGGLRIVLTVVGGALASGGASAFNHLLDRDIDRLMGGRTSSRPVASGRVAPARALEFGLALSAFSFVLLAATVNLLAAGLALLGNLLYVVVYTRWLKRSTEQNIVIGGAAGAVPPLVGYAAATGHLDATALALFGIIFFWTPPHFWALALLIRRHYAAAGVPMLPVIQGEAQTARQVWRYSVVLVAVTLAPLAWHAFGTPYLAASAALGAVFLVLAWELRRRVTPRRARFLFQYSLVYLALLFTAMAADRWLGG
jgi:protoheme IX farnesyltransferase